MSHNVTMDSGNPFVPPSNDSGSEKAPANINYCKLASRFLVPTMHTHCCIPVGTHHAHTLLYPSWYPPCTHTAVSQLVPTMHTHTAVSQLVPTMHTHTAVSQLYMDNVEYSFYRSLQCNEQIMNCFVDGFSKLVPPLALCSHVLDLPV